MVFIFAVLLLAVQASNLRSDSRELLQGVSSNFSKAFPHSSDDVTQDSTASASVNDELKVIKTQSSTDSSKVGGVNGVKVWAQCGGHYFVGETTCQPHTFCKQLSDYISVCFPESKPMEKVIRLEL